ncbi:hypothetical protein R1flu_006623 [Riccia fluitans]|uniref:Uncharacterized protein n=1 Tax=Riccia fluitans TaxID=41844 RepID=A0ABD1YXL6_9MARC
MRALPIAPRQIRMQAVANRSANDEMGSVRPSRWVTSVITELIRKRIGQPHSGNFSAGRNLPPNAQTGETPDAARWGWKMSARDCMPTLWRMSAFISAAHEDCIIVPRQGGWPTLGHDFGCAGESPFGSGNLSID